MAADVNIDIPRILALSERLRAEAEEFERATAAIEAAFGDGGVMSHAAMSDSPYGADARNVPAGAVMAAHGEAARRARQLIADSRESIHLAGRLTETIVSRLRGRDESDAAALDLVTRMLTEPRSGRES